MNINRYKEIPIQTEALMETKKDMFICQHGLKELV